MTHDRLPPYSSSTAQSKQGSALGSTNIVDFRSHVSGGAFQHFANDIYMDEPISILGGTFQAATVQETLEKITSYAACAGTGLVTVGDGYDACIATINVGDDATPTFETAMTAAFAHPRLENGGVVMIKSGTYRVRSTISVPAGISIIGEMGGTLIVGECNELPMFRALGAAQWLVNNPSGTHSLEPLDTIKFFNLTLIDNFDGYITSGGLPVPSMQTVPMILCDGGSNVSIDTVSFIGRLGDLGAVAPFGRPKTYQAINSFFGSSNTSSLTVEKCVFDNLETAISFGPSAVSSQLIVDKCRARTFGTDDAGDAADPSVNCMITIATGNARITNNYFIGEGLYSQAMVTLTSGAVQSVMVSDNFGIITHYTGSSRPLHLNGHLPGAGSLTGNLWKSNGSVVQYITPINGEDGGTYSPASEINITDAEGFGLTVDKLTVPITGQFTVAIGAQAQISGDITIDGQSLINNDVDIEGSTLFLGTGTSLIGGAAAGTAIFNNDVTLNGTTTFGGIPLMSSVAMDRYQPLVQHGSNGNWSIDGGLHWYESTLSSTGTVFWLTGLIDGSTLTSVQIKMNGSLNGGGHAAFPANMPAVSLFKENGTNTATVLATHTLDSAADFGSTIATYDATWNYSLTGLTEGIDKSVRNSYAIAVYGESGANSATGLTLLSIRCSFTVAQLRPG